MMSGELKPYLEYKDSGVEWLGEVPGHWEVRRLGQIGPLSKGNGGNKDDEVPAGIPCIRYGDLYTTHTYFIHDTRSYIPAERSKDYTPTRFGDVLFAASGETIEEIGKSAVNLIRSEAYCGGDVIVFRPIRQVVAKFMGYATDCRPAAIQKARMGRGITVNHIYGSQLKRLVVPLPSLSEQTAIARFLEHADRRIQRCIRAKENLIALLEEQKQVIIHHAVTGRIDVRTGKPYPARKDAGVEWLGSIPSHWDVTRLGKVIDLTVGFPFKSEGFTQSEEDIRLLRGINVAPGRLRWDDVVCWPAYDASNYTEFQLSVGDIILGMDRPIVGSGVRVAMVSEQDVPSLLLQRVARIRPIEAKLTREFAMRLLSGISFSDYLAPIFTGISVPHLSPEQIRGFPVALPSLAEQEAIGIHLDSIADRTARAVSSARTQISGMHEYRIRLIADVVTGKLDVREAAAALPEVDPLAADDPDDHAKAGGGPMSGTGTEMEEEFH